MSKLTETILNRLPDELPSTRMVSLLVDEIEALETVVELQRGEIATLENRTCEWTLDYKSPHPDSYNTECEHWTCRIIDKYSGYYCPHCGGKVVVK